MFAVILSLAFAAAFTLLGIFIAANNPALAQKFKTSGRKALDEVEEARRRVHDMLDKPNP